MNYKDENWKFDLRDVAIIGEYTTPSGPYLDDHFLVVILRTGQILECPTEGAKKILTTLESVTGKSVDLRLCNETDSASRVIYPDIFSEHPLFTFSKMRVQKGFFSFLKSLVNFGISEKSKNLTKELERYIKNEAADAGEMPA